MPRDKAYPKLCGSVMENANIMLSRNGVRTPGASCLRSAAVTLEVLEGDGNVGSSFASIQCNLADLPSIMTPIWISQERTALE